MPDARVKLLLPNEQVALVGSLDRVLCLQRQWLRRLSDLDRRQQTCMASEVHQLLVGAIRRAECGAAAGDDHKNDMRLLSRQCEPRDALARLLAEWLLRRRKPEDASRARLS